MKKLFWIGVAALLTQTASAQRCGYDFIHAFLIQLRETEDTTATPLKGYKITPYYALFNRIPETEAMAGMHQKPVQELREFLQKPENSRMHFAFFDSRQYASKQNPQWFLHIESPDVSLKNTANRGYWFPVRPHDGNYLCGNPGPFKVLKIGLSQCISDDSMAAKYPVAFQFSPNKKEPQIDFLKPDKQFKTPFHFQKDIPKSIDIFDPMDKFGGREFKDTQKNDRPSLGILKAPEEQPIPIPWKGYVVAQKMRKTIALRMGEVFRDSLFLLNTGSQPFELENCVLPAYRNYALFECRVLRIPKEIPGRDSAWLVYEVKRANSYQRNAERLPVEENNWSFQFPQKEAPTLIAQADYLIVDAADLQESQPQYRFKEPVPNLGFWVLDIADNQLNAYGKCVQKGDSLTRVGTWFMRGTLNTACYSNFFKFDVWQDGALVDAELRIMQIKNGKSEVLDICNLGQTRGVWVPPNIDTLLFENGAYRNVLMHFNGYARHFNIALFPLEKTAYFTRKYPQMHTYAPYEFIDTLFLVKMDMRAAGQSGILSPELIAQAAARKKARIQSIQNSDLGIVYFQPQNFESGFGLLFFPRDKRSAALKQISLWKERGWFEMVCQAVQLDKKEGVAYFQGEITVRPKDWIWKEAYTEVCNAHDLSKFHTYGDGTFQLKSKSPIFGEEAFLQALKFLDLAHWSHGQPVFFNPVRINMYEHLKD